MESFGKIYWYELKLRAAGPGCQPSDFISIEHCVGKWGIVSYNRKLTDKELSDYDLKEYKSKEDVNTYELMGTNRQTYTRKNRAVRNK